MGCSVNPISDRVYPIRRELVVNGRQSATAAKICAGPAMELHTRYGCPMGGLLGASGTVRNDGNDSGTGVGLKRQAACSILALQVSLDVRSSDRARPSPTPG